MNILKNLILTAVVLLSMNAQAASSPDGDAALYEEAAKRLFAKAVPLKVASVIEDSKGCLWGVSDNNPHGRLVTIELTDKGGEKQLCRKSK
jgi:hypothetical protein